MERVFHIFDKDDNGSISLQEFIDAMHQFAGQSPDDKIKFLFKVYDIDGKKDKQPDSRRRQSKRHRSSAPRPSADRPNLSSPAPAEIRIEPCKLGGQIVLLDLQRCAKSWTILPV